MKKKLKKNKENILFKEKKFDWSCQQKKKKRMETLYPLHGRHLFKRQKVL